MATPRLFCFGLGYSALELARGLMAEGWTVAGTCRTEENRAQAAAAGADAVIFEGNHPFDGAESTLAGVTHILSSVPPGSVGDPVLASHGEILGHLSGVIWAGYLSTTGVYGDTGGATVDETSPLNPGSDRSFERVAAEQAWRALHQQSGLPVHVFRLAGIYGPGRSALDQVRAGTARRIDKPGHKFSRIHVADIANVLRASMARPNPGAIYNLCDDEPAAAADVTAFACELLDLDPPPLIPFEAAAKEMPPMALSFWRDNRIVDNGRIKRELAVGLKYPTYRDGLRSILAAEA